MTKKFYKSILDGRFLLKDLLTGKEVESYSVESGFDSAFRDLLPDANFWAHRGERVLYLGNDTSKFDARFYRIWQNRVPKLYNGDWVVDLKTHRILVVYMWAKTNY